MQQSPLPCIGQLALGKLSTLIISYISTRLCWKAELRVSQTITILIIGWQHISFSEAPFTYMQSVSHIEAWHLGDGQFIVLIPTVVVTHLCGGNNTINWQTFWKLNINYAQCPKLVRMYHVRIMNVSCFAFARSPSTSILASLRKGPSSI